MKSRTNCEGVTRRDCLQLGMGGLIGGVMGIGVAKL